MTEWKDDDEFTTTYGTLKRALAEAAEAERERILEFVTNWTVKGNGDYPKGYKDALNAVAEHIRDDFGGN